MTATKKWSAFLFGKKAEPKPSLPNHDPLMSARRTDPSTSKESAQLLEPKGDQLRLLMAYYELTRGVGLPLSDRGAGYHAGIEAAHKRCGELRRKGLIEQNGSMNCPVTHRRVQTCEITSAGMEVVYQLGGAV